MMEKGKNIKESITNDSLGIKGRIVSGSLNSGRIILTDNGSMQVLGKLEDKREVVIGNSEYENIKFNSDGSLTVKGELEVKTIFDTLIDKIERDIKFNELTLCKDNIEIYMKFMGDSKWGDWKLKRIDHANRFSKIVKELSSSKVIELIELGYSRHVLKIDDIVKSLDTLINRLMYTTSKYSNLNTYDIVSNMYILENGKTSFPKILKSIKFNDPKSPLNTKFKVESKPIDDFEELIRKEILINLSNASANYRNVGKTTLLLKLCKENNATLVVPNHNAKKEVECELKKLGYHVPVRYIKYGDGVDFKDFYVDEFVNKETIEWLLDINTNCLGGFINHESFK